MKKRIAKTGDTWLPSEVGAFTSCIGVVAIGVGILLTNLLSFDWKAEYTKTAKEYREYQSTARDNQYETYRKGIEEGEENMRRHAIRSGLGSFKLSPTTGKAVFVYASPCRCEEGCKCSVK